MRKRRRSVNYLLHKLSLGGGRRKKGRRRENIPSLGSRRGGGGKQKPKERFLSRANFRIRHPSLPHLIIINRFSVSDDDDGRAIIPPQRVFPNSQIKGKYFISGLDGNRATSFSFPPILPNFRVSTNKVLRISSSSFVYIGSKLNICSWFFSMSPPSSHCSGLGCVLGRGLKAAATAWVGLAMLGVDKGGRPIRQPTKVDVDVRGEIRRLFPSQQL